MANLATGMRAGKCSWRYPIFSVMLPDPKRATSTMRKAGNLVRFQPIRFPSKFSVGTELTSTSSNRITLAARRTDILVRNGSSSSHGGKQYAREIRPTSPHVTIYKFPISAIASISHRITGVALTVGTLIIADVALLGSGNMTENIGYLHEHFPALIPVAKFAIAFPLSYHFLAGLRHLYWDYTGKGMHLTQVKQTSFAIIGLALFISLVLSAISIKRKKHDPGESSAHHH
eukprot:TRINITY_DN2188_c0_g1_i2.p1 TRINITY_DN2188_c0_g1~~TRINITY_DN2188_c0_g1_i2.p1  ORF type:complete len:231 (-),score=6.45 TRINITY_DN2188_c0_g1_i2:50-742(-)